MADEMIECYKLDVVRYIPAELTQLQDENSVLRQFNSTLKVGLVLLSLGVGIYIVTKIIADEGEEKEK